jgi:hypothetical protein
MNDEERFSEWVREALREIEPPPAPREEMWARIEQVRRSRRHNGDHPWLVNAIRWGLPLAATLVIGIGIGRLTAGRSASEPAFVETPGIVALPASTEPALPYRVAAVQHLVRTEALLTSLREDTRSGDTTDISGWARDLLTNTRLLIDSPASQDVQLGRLLEDLELILAQIAALDGAPPADELELIEDGIQRNDMITRLRNATNAPAFAGT